MLNVKVDDKISAKTDFVIMGGTYTYPYIYNPKTALVGA